MRWKIASAICGLLLLACGPASAQVFMGQTVASCGTAPSTRSAGIPYPVLMDTNGNFCTNASGGGGGGAVYGPTATGSAAANPPVLIGGTTTGGATGTVQGAAVNSSGQLLVAESNSAAIKTDLDTISTNSGLPLPTQAPTVSIGGVGQIPSANSANGLTPSTSSALVSSQVVKSGAGNLYSFEVAADATLSPSPWWIMVFNATSAPSDGAVTPLKCFAMPSNTTQYSASFQVPVQFSTGITIGVSTTGCFTKTASVHAFISGDAQ